MQPLGHAGEYRTTVSAGLIADRDHIWKKLPTLKNVEYALRCLAGDIDSDFLHGFDRERVERPGLEACAMRFEVIGTSEIQKRFRYLAARAVVNTDE